jgi:hypothetical protein
VTQQKLGSASTTHVIMSPPTHTPPPSMWTDSDTTETWQCEYHSCNYDSTHPYLTPH